MKNKQFYLAKISSVKDLFIDYSLLMLEDFHKMPEKVTLHSFITSHILHFSMF